MKNKIAFILFLFICNISISQTKFDQGFNNGYKKGYCHDQGVGCIQPIPPLPPIPKANESSDKYNDGYNRGFQMGLQSRNKTDNSSTNGVNRGRFKTAKPEFIDGIQEPNTELKLLLAKKQMEHDKLNKELGSAMQELINKMEYEINSENYDYCIRELTRLLKVSPNPEIKSQLSFYLSLSYLGKYYEKDKYTDFMNSYNYSVQYFQLSRDTSLLEKTSSIINYKLKLLASKSLYERIISIGDDVIYKNGHIKFWLGFGHYYLRDYKQAKLYFKDIKKNEDGKTYLKAIKSKSHIKNPYLIDK